MTKRKRGPEVICQLPVFDFSTETNAVHVLVQTDRNSQSSATLKIAYYYNMLPWQGNEQKKSRVIEKQRY